MNNNNGLDRNWKELGQLLHQCVEDCLSYLESAATGSERGFAKSKFEPSELPQDGTAPEAVYTQIKKIMIDQPQFLNTHPGFLGWSLGAGSAYNLLSSILVATVNASVQTPAQVSTQIELEVLRWIKQIFSWPEFGTGLFVSGSAMGNLMALLAARHQFSANTKQNGNRLLPEKMTVLGSEQTHFTIARGLHVIGLGEQAFKPVQTNPDGSIHIQALQREIELAENPLCVVGNLGTTASGAFDDIRALAEICQSKKLWLHVDAAWGAWLALDKTKKHLVEGMELADSITIDGHKFPGAPVGTGIVLFQKQTKLEEIFTVENPYLEFLSGSEFAFGNMGIELTRPQRALALWMIFKIYGTKRIGEMVAAACASANEFSAALKKNASIELAYPVTSNTVVFRIRKPKQSDEENSRDTLKMIRSLWQEGQVMPSTLTVDGKVYARFCFLNHEFKKIDNLKLISKIYLEGGIT